MGVAVYMIYLVTTRVHEVHSDIILFFVEDHIQTALWDLLHHLSFLYQHSLCQVNSWTTKSPRLRHRNQRTYMVAEQIMYQLDFPPPQHNHLHLLSFPCCHGYRVKQHYCKAWAAELRLCSSTWLTDLSWMGCSDQWPKGGNCLSTIKQGDDMYLNMCVCVCVCGTNTVKACTCGMTCLSVYMQVYISMSSRLYICHSLSVCPFIAPHLSHMCAVTGFLRADTAALWRWSNPPGRTAGTQKCASRRPPASSTAASVHGARRGSPGHRASGSLSPPAPVLHDCSCLKGGSGEGECGCRRRD